MLLASQPASQNQIEAGFCGRLVVLGRECEGGGWGVRWLTRLGTYVALAGRASFRDRLPSTWSKNCGNWMRMEREEWSHSQGQTNMNSLSAQSGALLE